MTGKPLRILLVEDSDNDALILERHLAVAAPSSPRARARSGAEALARAAEKPDLIFLDHNLGDANALALLGQIWTRAPLARVVLMSGHMDERLAAAALRLGAMDVLAKDELTPENLARLLERADPAVAPPAPGDEPPETERLGRFARHAHKIYEALLETMFEGCSMVDRDGLIVLANPALERMAGRTLAGTNEKNLFTAATCEGLHLARFPPDGRVPGRRRIEGGLVPLVGAEVPVLLSGTPLLDSVGRYEGSFLVVTDLTERKELERRLREEAARDPLTGLGNRRAFESEFEATLHRASRSGEPVALLVFDLDGLKAINDTRGHESGDRLLCAFARGLGTTSRIVDGLYRFGGDEFAAILPSTARAGADAFVARLRAALEAEPEKPEASVGIAIFPNDATDPKALFDFADRLMYEEKRERKAAAGS